MSAWPKDKPPSGGKARGSIARTCSTRTAPPPLDSDCGSQAEIDGGSYDPPTASGRMYSPTGQETIGEADRRPLQVLTPLAARGRKTVLCHPSENDGGGYARSQ